MRARNYLLLAFLGCVWGSSFLFIEIALRGFGPVAIAAGRIMIGAVFFAVVVVVGGYRLPVGIRRWAGFFALGLAAHTIPFSLISLGQDRIDSGLAAILIAAVPLFTLVLAHVFTDDRINASKVVGVLMGFAGVIVLIGPEALAGLSDQFWGQLMIVGATMSFAVALVLTRRMPPTPPPVSAACSLACASLLIVPAALVLEPVPVALPPTDAVLALLALGLVSTGLAILVFFRLTASAGPNFVAANNYLATSVGVFWGVVLLGERLSWQAFLALGVILLGVGIATLRPVPAKVSADAGR